MHVQMDLTSLFIYFLHLIFVSATARIGLFKVSQRNPKIKKCASQLLSKREFNVTRVHLSETTAKCESWSSQWDDEHIEATYGYAKSSYMKDNMRPPKIISHLGEYITNIPRLTDGTSFNVNVTWPTKMWDMIVIMLYEGPRYGFDSALEISFSSPKIHARDLMSNNKRISVNYPYDNFPGNEHKISFLATGNNTIKMLINGGSVVSVTGQNTSFDQLERMSIFYKDYIHKKVLLVQGTEFSQDSFSGTNFTISYK